MKGEARYIEEWGRHNPDYGNVRPFADKWDIPRPKRKKRAKSKRGERSVSLNSDGSITVRSRKRVVRKTKKK